MKKKTTALRALLLSALALLLVPVLAVDGFLVSENVTATARVPDVGFAYSDHNPVLLEFMLML